MKWNAYWRLARFDKPVGILLLWFPTAWALWLASNGMPPMRLLILFILGTICMRAAGCVINDLADSKIDKHVERTKLRPLACGEVSFAEALAVLGVFLVGALIILMQLPKSCIKWAFLALTITAIYPFCKRFLHAPQLILGLAFSMGIPMAYAAVGVAFDSQFILLFLLNFVWIVSYDTMYAMTDKADDLVIGVKSTALYFANYDRLIIGILLSIMHVLWLYLALFTQADLCFYLLWIVAAGVLLYQQRLIHNRVPAKCFQAFRISSVYGLLMWFAVMMK